MAKTTIDTWNPEFLTLSAVFNTLRSTAEIYQQCTQWPTLEQLQQQFQNAGLPVKPVPQGNKPVTFEDHYEPRIYLKHELQTRTENWHDFLNAMIWLRFTKTKSTLNQRHYFAALEREAGSNRSPIENAITLFDECGIIIISDDENLLQLIRQHQWQDLFMHNRDAFNSHIFCYVFGHAMYEKMLSPYIGITAQAMLIHSADLIKECEIQNFEKIDQFVASEWHSGNISSSRDLSPFPLLGIPGLHEDNINASFYNNKDYFRPLK